MHEKNSFITLTYNDEHLPERGLKHKDFQNFMKRLRKKHKTLYYMAGEYGEINGRPHYHAGLFGLDWEDKIYQQTTASGEKIYTSEALSKLWGMGYASTAAVTFESMAYVARYCLKKITGDMAEEHYKRFDYLGEYQLPPEYNKMSLKPAIGKKWLEKYEKDVFTFDYVIVNGHESRVPKYYDKLFEASNPDKFEELKNERIIQAISRQGDNTQERLKAKEKIAIAKTKSLLRGKI